MFAEENVKLFATAGRTNCAVAAPHGFCKVSWKHPLVALIQHELVDGLTAVVCRTRLEEIVDWILHIVHATEILTVCLGKSTPGRAHRFIQTLSSPPSVAFPIALTQTKEHVGFPSRTADVGSRANTQLRPAVGTTVE